MNSLKKIFTPLDKKYCNYFYYISVISFCLFIFISKLTAWNLVFNLKKEKYNCLSFINVIISLFLSYFVNRLMYSMCVKSL